MKATTTLREIRAAKDALGLEMDVYDFVNIGLKFTDHSDTDEIKITDIAERCKITTTLWILANVFREEDLCVSFSADVAEHVLHVFEEEFPGQNIPHNAINLARGVPRNADAASVAEIAETVLRNLTSSGRLAYAAAMAAVCSAKAACYVDGETLVDIDTFDACEYAVMAVEDGRREEIAWQNARLLEIIRAKIAEAGNA